MKNNVDQKSKLQVKSVNYKGRRYYNSDHRQKENEVKVNKYCITKLDQDIPENSTQHVQYLHNY